MNEAKHDSTLQREDKELLVRRHDEEGFTTTVDSVPDDAMQVEADHQGQNYVKFKTTNVIEWYTDFSDSDEIQRETFTKAIPSR